MYRLFANIYIPSWNLILVGSWALSLLLLSHNLEEENCQMLKQKNPFKWLFLDQFAPLSGSPICKIKTTKSSAHLEKKINSISEYVILHVAGSCHYVCMSVYK